MTLIGIKLSSFYTINLRKIIDSINQTMKIAVYFRGLMFLAFIMACAYCNAQQLIKGKVISRDNDLPIQGASIKVQGSTKGTLTDAAGHFSIEASGSDILVVSSVGYFSKEISINNRSTIDVALEVDVTSLSEVVVMGYGVQQKRDITGSVSQVQTKELEAIPVYNTEQALKGRAAGVQVSQNSGTPGGRIEVRIRGGNSMIGDNAPLYVVDGFPVTGGINYLNPADIESMDILKDASATAIYGARGANGVVLITTKQGKEGQIGRIDIHTSYGMQREIDRYTMLNPSQYAIVANEWLKNEGRPPFFNLDDLPEENTDWQDVIFRKAPIQNHTLTFSGASEKSHYSLSGNYYGQEGIVKSSSAKRGNIRLNLFHELNKRITLGFNVTLARREIYEVPLDNASFGENGRVSGHLSAPPTLPVYDENGVPTRIEHIYSFGSQDMRNPVTFLAPRKDRQLSNAILGNTTLDVKLTDDLVFKTLLGLEYENNNNELFVPVIFEDDRGAAEDSHSYFNSFLNENTLTYSKTFNEAHNINAVVGFTYQSYMNRNAGISVSQLTSNITENYNLGSATLISPPTSGFSEWKLLSGLGRVNYSFLGKYMFTVSFRSDGSSRFGTANKWGYFPSAAVAWRISDESFMEGLGFIDDFKIRASYGISGNTALSPYQSLSRISSTRVVFENQNEVVGYIPTGVANPSLKWETTAQSDIGADLSLFTGRISFVFDYYRKITSNLLASVPLPTSTGFGSVLQNIGETQNHGVEFSLSADILNPDKAFNWDATVQLSSNRNKIRSLASDSDIIGSSLSHPFNAPTNIARINQPFGAFYGLIEDGLDANGLIKYVDINDDGVVNASDRVILGTPYPDFIFSINNNLSYRNFSLNVFVEGVQGNEIFWATSGTFLNSFQRGHNQFVDIIGNYWTAENPDPHAKYPKISSQTAAQVSDRYIKDGSYIRLKSVTLNYEIPVQNLGVEWCKNATLFVSGTNLFTLTDYPGLDPEVNTTGTDNQNVGNRLSMGIDQGAYPSTKTFFFGARLGF